MESKLFGKGTVRMAEVSMERVFRALLGMLALALLAACGANSAPTAIGGNVAPAGGAAGGLPNLQGRTLVIGTDATYPVSCEKAIYMM